MSDQPERWDLVGAAIARRLDQLKVTAAEIERQHGISWDTLRRYRSGAPVVRKDKQRHLLEALRWTDDSIERLLDGEPPTTWEEDLDKAQEAFDRAAFEVVESGGSEEVRHYRWLWDQVNERRARLGRDPHAGHPAALPHVAIRGLLREELVKRLPETVKPSALEEQVTLLAGELRSLAQSVQLLLEEELPRLRGDVEALLAAREA